MKALLRPLTWLLFAALAFACQPAFAQSSCVTTSALRGLSTKTVVYGRDSAVVYRVYQDSIRTRCKPTLTDTTTVAVVPAVPVDTALAPPVVVPPPPASGGGNLATMTFESGTFEGLSDGGGGKPIAGSIATSGCYAGSKCFDINLPASSGDQGGSGYWLGGNYTDIWVSFALNVLKSPTSGGVETQKMLIFRNTGSAPNQFGELNQAYGGWIWSWLFTESGPNYPVNGLPAPTTPGWHRYKVHFRCGPPASLAIGVDGKENVWTKQTAGAGCPATPTAITFGGTLNANSGASHFQFDNIKIGTMDPGWP
jgi:hypothetical protein